MSRSRPFQFSTTTSKTLPEKTRRDEIGSLTKRVSPRGGAPRSRTTADRRRERCRAHAPGHASPGRRRGRACAPPSAEPAARKSPCGERGAEEERLLLG